MDLNHSRPMFITPEAHFETLDRTISDGDDYALAIRVAPCIRFDVREPFLPSVVGYTIFRSEGKSASFPRDITLPLGTVCVIEYAIWWDWDIQHLYELEHIWLYLDANENIVGSDASWHGGMHTMVDSDGRVPMEEGRVTLYSESGKHAFAPVRDWLIERKPQTDQSCGRLSGAMGVHITPLFAGLIQDRTPLKNNVVHAYLERLAFEPTYDFSNIFDLRSAVFVPWMMLFEWIPSRVNWWANFLAMTMPPGQRRPLRIAHRGASAYAQEGSQASVEKAAELGSDMVEIDLRVTADDVPIIAHDSSLQRVFGIDGSIAEMTLEELRAVTPPHRQPILTFDEMLELCLSLGLGLYLDIKEITPGSAAKVVENLQQRGMLNHSIFGSFRPDVIAEIKANAPDVVTSILFSSTHIDPVALAIACRADYVHPCWERFSSPADLLTPDWIDAVRAANLGIVCWHEERPEVITALNELGVEGICSDQPELLRR